MSRVQTSRLAATAPLDLFTAGIAKPTDEQTCTKPLKISVPIDADAVTALLGNPVGRLAATN